MTSDHRWQGYGHAELYEKIQSGPGPKGSEQSMRRWTEMIAALDEIDQDLHRALDRSTEGWLGAAGDQARAGLNPLRQWAVSAQAEAETMRLSAELQAGYIAKARNDMPPPSAIQAEQPSTMDSVLTHLFGGQTDYELQEAAADAAEQKAFDVMAVYQASTESNTATLGRFTPAPQVVVDTALVPVTRRAVAEPTVPAELEPGPTGGRESTRDSVRRNRITRSTGNRAARGTNPRPAAEPTKPAASATSEAERGVPTESAGRAPTGSAAEPEHREPLLEEQDAFGEQHLVAPPVLGVGGAR